MERIFNLFDLMKSSDDAATKTPVFSTECTSGVVWVVKPGQTVQKHFHSATEDIWIVLQGEGIFYPTPDSEVPIKKGTMILNNMKDCHGCKNTGAEDLIFAGILAPLPSDFNAIN